MTYIRRQQQHSRQGKGCKCQCFTTHCYLVLYIQYRQQSFQNPCSCNGTCINSTDSPTPLGICKSSSNMQLSLVVHYMIIQMLPPTMPMMTNIVKILAPAVSAVVMGFCFATGCPEFEPAFGSDADVPPVLDVSGAMSGVIKLAPMTLRACI